MFSNPLGLYALGGLLLLILLYLRRPKPLERVIPSLMFLMKEKGNQKRYSLFKKIVSNILFLLQFLTITTMAFAVAEPFLNFAYETTAKNTVIVVDVSASMQTKEGFSTRFDKAIEQAKKEARGTVSIIAASVVPNVLLKEGSRGEAKSILSALEPTDMPTNIEGALFEAESILSNKKGNIVVVSDFVVDEEADQPLKAKVVLESKGHTLVFRDVGDEAHNVGITELIVQKDTVKAFVKNFQEETVTATIDLLQNNNVMETKKVAVDGDSLEVITFPLLRGVSKIALNHDDDLAVDNIVHVSTPARDKMDVVLITSLKEGSAPTRSQQPQYLNHNSLFRALTSLTDVTLHIVRPPRMIITTANQDVLDINPRVIVLHNINKDELISHGLADYKRLVENGASLIITPQEDLAQIDLEGMLPLTITGVGEDTNACVDVVNFFTKRFEENKCFTETNKYLISTPLNGSLVIASARDNSPLMVLADQNGGTVFYYGIFDDYSPFKAEENYPIFWNNVLSFLTQTEDIQSFTRKFSDEGMFTLKNVGIHDVEDKKIAVNLLSEIESNINKKPEEFKTGSIQAERSRGNAQFDIAIPLAALAAFIILLEIIVVKVRGDL